MLANREYITKKQINNDTPSPESIKVMIYLINAVGIEPCSGYSSPLSLSVSRFRRRTQLRARTNARQYNDRQDTRYDDKQSGDSSVLVSAANCISVKMRRKGFESERSQ